MMVLRSGFILVICIVMHSVKGDDGVGYCAKPIIETENVVDIKFLHAHYNEGWNTQFGNPALRKFITKLLQGKKDIPDDMDYSNICLRTTFDFQDAHHIIGTVSGFGGLTADWNCTDHSYIYDCNFYNAKNGYTDAAKIYMTYFDGNPGHNTFGLAFCYPDGNQVGWYANSISKTLTNKETTTILDRFTALGFDPAVRVPLRTESCQ